VAGRRDSSDEVREALELMAAAAREAGASAVLLAPPLAELVAEADISADGNDLRDLLVAARLDEPALVDVATAEQMVRPYSWLLDRAGTDGIKLTSAGRLAPADVEAAMTELNLHEEWIGKGNREAQTLPVLHLRESAMKVGLLHRYRGRLVATPRGRSLRGNPVGLWWLLAEQVPLKAPEEIEAHAGLLLLTVIAAGSSGDLDQEVARLLGEVGWARPDGTPVSDSMAALAVFDTKTVLRRIGCFRPERPFLARETPNPDGVTFARAALQTWPG
jgi:hypothetical protein